MYCNQLFFLRNKNILICFGFCCCTITSESFNLAAHNADILHFLRLGVYTTVLFLKDDFNSIIADLFLVWYRQI